MAKPSESWETWVETTGEAGLILTALDSEATWFETHPFTSQNVSYLAEKLMLTSRSFEAVKEELEQLGGEIRKKPDGSFRVKFTKVNFVPR